MKCTEKPLTFNSEGYELVGFLHLPRAENFPFVVFFHGFTGTKVEPNRLFVDLARLLCENGIGAFRFDYRGHGESPLSFEDFELPLAIMDAENALKFVEENIKITKMGIIGLSMGGHIAIIMAARHPEISAVVLLSPAIDFSALLKPDLNEHKEYYIIGPQRIKEKGFLSLAHANTMGLAEKIIQPILIIHAKDDPAIPYTQSVEFYNKVTTKDKKLFLLDEGFHTFDTYESRKRVQEEVIKWFKRYLF